MDNHVGDWLYYIVILVVAIVSFVGNQNKKKSQGQTQPSAPAPSIEEMLPPAQTRRKKNPPPAPKPRRTFSPSISTGVEEGRRMLNEEALAFAEKIETSRVDELNLTDTDAFRKAFISAEILNRKYSY
ncbi:MAG: hypothetical protein LBR86_05615 [Tannerella sp.]|nr:hypothetical protein [Tannerella sp.]